MSLSGDRSRKDFKVTTQPTLFQDVNLGYCNMQMYLLLPQQVTSEPWGQSCPMGKLRWQASLNVEWTGRPVIWGRGWMSQTYFSPSFWTGFSANQVAIPSVNQLHPPPVHEKVAAKVHQKVEVPSPWRNGLRRSCHAVLLISPFSYLVSITPLMNNLRRSCHVML